MRLLLVFSGSSSSHFSSDHATEFSKPGRKVQIELGKLTAVFLYIDLGERPRWDAAVVGAGPAQLLALDQDNLGP